MRTSWLALAALLPLTGCAFLKSITGGGDADSIVYGADADDNLKRGDEALDSKNFPEAQRYYEYVKTKYPYLEAAKLAELRLADTDFDRDRFLEARDRYANFVRLHPTHAKVDYAAFRAALTHYKDIPSTFFLLPPASEKDQVELRSALTALNAFVRDYPDSTYVAESNQALADVKRRLADHELYVAGFYAKRDKWNAVVNRLTTVARNYAGIGYDDKVAFGLYDAYLALKNDDKAKEALRSYIEKYPDTAEAKRAQRLLEKK